MNTYYSIFKTILYTLILLGIFNSSYSKTNNFNYDAKNISNYFSGLVSFYNFEYKDSEKFFKKLKNFENVENNYSSKLIQSLINLEKFNEAKIYAKKSAPNFESNLILGLNEFKKGRYSKAEIYFNKLEPNLENRLIFQTIKTSLTNWLEIVKTGKKGSLSSIQKLSNNYQNFKLIQSAFANCYLNTNNTTKEFEKMISNTSYDFSRYYFFYANYLLQKNNISKAKNLLVDAHEKYPGNLLIHQYKKVIINKEKNKNQFNCERPDNILAEIFYIIANALSSTGNYKLSNFYTNLSKFLNPEFSSFNTLLAENFLYLKKYETAQNIYKKLSHVGSVYYWYSNKQISNILNTTKNKSESINYFSKIYRSIKPNIYQTYDYANFLRSHEQYDDSINLYTEILSRIDENHQLYPKVLDRRGMSYERVNKWTLAEKDLLMSLEKSPDEPYVMNYLAYSWVEKGKNIGQALEMLKKANNLKKNDGYITDSLGWALYKLEKFLEAKKYLRMAVTIMPTDPVVNDHFADCLWMNDQKLQARYYWNYVLGLKSADKELKENIEKKLLFGLEKIKL